MRAEAHSIVTRVLHSSRETWAVEETFLDVFRKYESSCTNWPRKIMELQRACFFTTNGSGLENEAIGCANSKLWQQKGRRKGWQDTHGSHAHPRPVAYRETQRRQRQTHTHTHNTHTHRYIYIYICVCVCVYTHVYILRPL